jgi:hypothetical protein
MGNRNAEFVIGRTLKNASKNTTVSKTASVPDYENVGG